MKKREMRTEGPVSRRRFLQGAAAAGAFGLLNAGCAASGEGAAGAERPNILLIFSDEMDPGYLGCYGGDFMTPNLDSLAREGVRFRQAYCVSAVCAPSRFNLLTGLYSGHCRHPGFLRSNPTDAPYLLTWNPGVRTDAPTIPRALSRAGYYTGFVGKFGITFADSNADWDIPRFEKTDDPDDPEVDRKLRRKQRIMRERVKHTAGFDYAASVMPGNVHNPIPELHHHQFEWITEGALNFLDQAARRERPWFLYAATTAVHGPGHVADLDADPRYTLGGKREKPFTGHPPRRTIRERLQEAGLPVDHAHVGMLFLDDHVGALLQKLQERGMAENTLVLFVADHGIEPGKATCYQRGTRVPALMRWPGHLPGGTTTDARVSFVDVLPTFCEAARAAPPARGDGMSFLPAVARGASLPRDYLYFEIGTARAVLKDDYKFVAFRYREPAIERMKSEEAEVAVDWFESTHQMHSQIAMNYFPGYFDPDQLYDLSSDPWEQRNLAGDREHRAAFDEMKSTLAEALEQFRHPYPLPVPRFMRSRRYLELVEKRLAPGTDPVGWWPKDFPWPPEKP